MRCRCQPYTVAITACCCPEDDGTSHTRRDRLFFNLSEVHRAGRPGLTAAFPVGSYVEYGPFTSDRDPEVYEVMPHRGGSPAHTSGINYSKQCDDAEAEGKPCWFIQARLVYRPLDYGPRSERRPGYITGLPPATLAPLTPRMAVVAGLACCDCAAYTPPCQQRILSCNAGVVQSARAEAESLRETITEQAAQIDNLEGKLIAAEDAHRKALAHYERRIQKARSALL